MVRRLPYALTVALLLAVAPMFAQASIPEWCRALPRPEYNGLARKPVSDSWFEVYQVAPGVFAIYEPHQFEETISYLMTGDKRAALFDTCMGIGDLKNGDHRADSAAHHRAEFAHTQRSRWRQLAISNRLRCGFGLHPH